MERVLDRITDYVLSDFQPSEKAMETARIAFLDSLGCLSLALQYSACTRLLGPVVPGAEMPNGVRVPGTSYELDPVQAAFNIGTLIRWLDFNDTWLAQEWGHPSDNLGAILSVADYLNRTHKKDIRLKDIFIWMCKAYEIQGVLALENSFNRVGLDHVILVKVASSAVATAMLGGNRDQVMSVLTHAFVDGHPLRTYRHKPNTMSRKSWAAGDATSRAVWLSFMCLAGESALFTPLSEKTWGFSDVLFRGKEVVLARELGSYVMENILFKVSYPVEFHAQSAVECAIQLHPTVKGQFDDVESITIWTQEAGKRIIDKKGPLTSPADRDHCLQYAVAVALMEGDLQALHYENEYAQNHFLIEKLREKMVVFEDPSYTSFYFDPDQRSIANSIQITFKDGSKSEKIEILFPIGHQRRRKESLPFLRTKLQRNLSATFSNETVDSCLSLFDDLLSLDQMTYEKFVVVLK